MKVSSLKRQNGNHFDLNMVAASLGINSRSEEALAFALRNGNDDSGGRLARIVTAMNSFIRTFQEGVRPFPDILLCSFLVDSNRF